MGGWGKRASSRHGQHKARSVTKLLSRHHYLDWRCLFNLASSYVLFESVSYLAYGLLSRDVECLHRESFWNQSTRLRGLLKQPQHTGPL